MKKKLMTVFAAFVLATSMTACGNADSVQTTDKETQTVQESVVFEQDRAWGSTPPPVAAAPPPTPPPAAPSQHLLQLRRRRVSPFRQATRRASHCRKPLRHSRQHAAPRRLVPIRLVVHASALFFGFPLR